MFLSFSLLQDEMFLSFFFTHTWTCTRFIAVYIWCWIHFFTLPFLFSLCMYEGYVCCSIHVRFITVCIHLFYSLSLYIRCWMYTYTCADAHMRVVYVATFSVDIRLHTLASLEAAFVIEYTFSLSLSLCIRCWMHLRMCMHTYEGSVCCHIFDLW